MKTLILGARGNIGSHLASCLQGTAGTDLYLASHSDKGVADLATRFEDASAVKVDLKDAATMVEALQGMHRVVVISPDFTDENLATGNLVAALQGSDSLQQIIRVLGLFPIVQEDDVPVSYTHLTLPTIYSV